MLRSGKCRLHSLDGWSPFPCSCMLGRKVNRTPQQALRGIRRSRPPNIWRSRRRLPRTTSSKIDAEPVSSRQRPQYFRFNWRAKISIETAQVDQKAGRDVCSISSRACPLQNTADLAHRGSFKSAIRALTARRHWHNCCYEMWKTERRLSADPVRSGENSTLRWTEGGKVKCRFQPSATRTSRQMLEPRLLEYNGRKDLRPCISNRE